MEHKTSQSFWETKLVLPLSIVAAAVIVAGSVIYVYRPASVPTTKTTALQKAKSIVPDKVELPAVWGDLGARMVEAGVIDEQAFTNLYNQRGGLTEDDKKLLLGKDNGKLVITKQNSGVILNLLWALGLGTKNPILEKGPISDKQYGGFEKFASTGGYVFASGKMKDHFSKHAFVTLTPEQQALVEKVSATIYRPCCDNPAIFPDCNHGMAMLGLLELMASQGASEKDMYKAALAVNVMWFPGTYENIADFMAQKGLDFSKQDPAALLERTYSSASGYQQILKEIQPSTNRGGGSCGA